MEPLPPEGSYDELEMSAVLADNPPNTLALAKEVLAQVSNHRKELHALLSGSEAAWSAKQAALLLDYRKVMDFARSTSRAHVEDYKTQLSKSSFGAAVLKAYYHPDEADRDILNASTMADSATRWDGRSFSVPTLSLLLSSPSHGGRRTGKEKGRFIEGKVRSV